ncbi:hypothetical protein LCGC14_3158240, partial [marine sediment metagenome]
MAKSGPKQIQPQQVSVGKRTLNGRQKAAVFLVTLGSEVSAEIFKHLR